MTAWRTGTATVLATWLCVLGVHSQEAPPGPKPTLYLVTNSHLDTQWNWTVQDSIRQFIPATFYDNFSLIERFPDYVFNLESVIHYMWFKEYHPEAWPTLQKYVAAGRWRLAGSWIDAADTNVPSPESLMRQALYGKRFYRREFNSVSEDVYLPDCFGFGFALPSIGAHSGLRAFSTQKLSWGASKPAPFAVGTWRGVDGSSLVAALRPGDYVMQVTDDISTDPKWTSDLVSLGDGRQVGFRYYGVGDVGGAPGASSVEWVEKAIRNRDGVVAVRNTGADQLARDLTDAERAALPSYEGELLLKTHGVGCYTSQAAMKAWNRRNEQLADAAERASVAAAWLGGPAYPGERLRTAWIRFLWHQFHDDLTGTSIPQAYQFSWNDELLSLNQFASILTSAATAVASGLDTRAVAPPRPPARAARAAAAASVPLVVYNPLAARRRDPVEASVQFASAAPPAVRVIDTTTGQDVPAQILSSAGTRARVLFIADMAPVSFRVFEVRAGAPPAAAAPSALTASLSGLENARYAVRLDANGDLASIMDKEIGVELLAAPARLAMFDDVSPNWPAWEILWDSLRRPPREHVAGTPAVRVIERGPARVALEVTRTAAGSTVVQRIRLAEGGDRVVVETDIDWRTPGTVLKATFPLAVSNPTATYDLGLGTIERPNAGPDLYEVPAQQWADITDPAGRLGVAILNDAKYGWDKPGDHELRLTLIHTPTPKNSFVYQSSNDIGRHRFSYAVAGHAGDWRAGRVPERAARLNQPPVAFQAPAHDGPLGRAFALLELSDTAGQVAVRALKKAEDSDAIVLRVQERYGRPAAGVRVSLAGGIREARAINAAEEALPEGQAGAATVADAALVFDLKPYEPRTFALTVGEPPARERLRSITSTPVALPFNLDGISSEARRADGDFDGHGRALPAEQLPASLTLDGITFTLGPTTDGAANVVVPKGQKVPLPAGTYNRVYVLATAVGGDASGVLTVERRRATPARAPFDVQEWTGAIGQWNSRLRDDRLLRQVYVPGIKGQSWPLEEIRTQLVTRWQPGAAAPVAGMDQIRPGFVKRDEVAWVATHLHDAIGNEPYIFGYVFKYGLDLPAGATTVVLPINARMRWLAMSVANEPEPGTRPAGLLYVPEYPGTRTRLAR